MGFLGFKSSSEIEAEKRKAAEEAAKLAAEQQKAIALAAEKAKEDAIKNNLVNLSNLSRGSQVNFAIPYFDIFDPRLPEYGVPCAVHGCIVYSIDDMDLFNQINKNEAFSDETFKNKLKGQVTKFVKSVVTNAPTDAQIPVIQIERKIVEISELVQQLVAPKVERLFGITVRSLDITNIMIDKASQGYREIKALTVDLDKENRLAQHNAGLSNFKLQNSINQDQLRMQSSLSLDAMKRKQELNLGGQEEIQRMQLENQRETLRIQREEMQRASRLQTEQTFLDAHKSNLNADNGFNAFAQPQSINNNTFGQNSLSGGIPQMPQMGGMPQMNAVPQVQYMVGVNGQPAGPFNWNQLQQLVQSGQLTQQTQVWKQGMPQWALAGQVMELQPLFVNQTPVMGGMPPMM